METIIRLYLFISILFVCNGSIAQTVTGCDFFPDKKEVTYTYAEPGLLGIQTLEIKYIYKDNVELQGKIYKAYDKYVNGMLPEINRVLYVNCSGNTLVMGNEIYAYNQELVGYEQDITKVIDIWATPVYEVSMQPTGRYYLPTVIKPNLPVGETWIEKSAMHGQMVTIKSSMFQKDISTTVQGKTFEHVYVVAQEVWSEGGLMSKQKIVTSKVFFARGFGMIKTEKTMYVMGKGIEMVTELINNEGNRQLIAEINSLMETIPRDNDWYTLKKLLSKNANSLPYDNLVKIRDGLKKMNKESTVNTITQKQGNSINNAEPTDKKGEEKKQMFDKFAGQMQVNGIIAEELLGTWESVGPKIPTFYKFYEDGTVEFFMTSLEPRNTYYKRHMFRVNGNNLETLKKTSNGTPWYTKYEMIWSANPDTGKITFRLKEIAGNDTRNNFRKIIHKNGQAYSPIYQKMEE